MRGFGSVFGNQAGIAIFGGGHIAQCLAKVAVLTGFSITVIENRQEMSSCFDGVRYLVCEPDDYDSVNAIGSCEYAVICTRGHGTDAEALRYCLTKPLKYLGMIGSATKSAQVLEIMREENAPQDKLDSVFTPIGLDIASGSPQEIAISILSEILLVKNNGTPSHKRGARGA